MDDDHRRHRSARPSRGAPDRTPVGRHGRGRPGPRSLRGGGARRHDRVDRSRAHTPGRPGVPGRRPRCGPVGPRPVPGRGRHPDARPRQPGARGPRLPPRAVRRAARRGRPVPAGRVRVDRHPRPGDAGRLGGRPGARGLGAVVRVGPDDVAPAGWRPSRARAACSSRGSRWRRTRRRGRRADAGRRAGDDRPGRADEARTVPAADDRARDLPGHPSWRAARRDGRGAAAPAGVDRDQRRLHDPEHRGQGFGRRLVLAVAHGIRARGEVPLMHAAAGNTGAIGLYEHLGFRQRERGALRFVQVP